MLAKLNRVAQGAPAVEVLTGPSGAGKTEVAAAYARAKVAAGWRLVAWVNAGNVGSLLAGLAAVADAVRLSDAGSGPGTADSGQAVRHWLEADGERCLLVFDGVEALEMLRPFVPVSGVAQVLVTAARESVADLGTRIPVDVFSTEEALALLGERTGLADEDGALAVAAELGYLPLAVDHAAALIASRRMGYGEYLERLRSRGKHLTLEEEGPYPQGVAAALMLSVEAIRADDPVGLCAGVVETMAVLSRTGVRRELLQAVHHEDVRARRRRRARTSATLDRALQHLAERSLLRFSLDAQLVVAHCLVMQVVRDDLARRGRLTAACRAGASGLEIRAEALAHSQDRTALRDFPEQVKALVENAPGALVEADDELATMLLSLRLWALYRLNDLGDSASQAIAVGEPLVADFEQVLGPDHPDTVDSRNSLALAYLAGGQAAEAIPLFERTLIEQERLRGPDDPHTLTSQCNLATAYLNAGRAAEAILHFELTLAARERVLGPDHPDTLNSGSGLASAYLAAGRPAEAILLFELILPAREWLLGPDHLSTVITRGNLASAYREGGQLAEAISLFELTLAARERVLGPEHPDTLSSRNNLANAYREAGRAAEAIPLVELTLAAQERVLGRDHPKVLSSRHNLGVVYREAGRAAEAIPLFEQTLAACERLLGADHRRTLSSRHDLGVVYREAGRAAEAIPLLAQTLAAQERLLGADHPSTLTTRNDLAVSYQETAGQPE